MSELPEFPRFEETFARPEALLRVPVGFASPLWGLFAGAAAAGTAWWWMSRWARPQNLEAMFGPTAVATPPALAPAAEPVEAAVAEAEPAMAAVVEPPVLETPIGGEAAPVAPAVAVQAEPVAAPEPEVLAEPEAAPKPRVKKAEPRPE
jgi:hypothetical protein